MPLHIPRLAKKLRYLYQHSTNIHTHESLARNLGIAPNNISVWINGNEVRVPDLVPNRHVKNLTSLFDIPIEWLELESLEEFKALLGAASAPNSAPWVRLLEQAMSCDAIELVRSNHCPDQPPIFRGLVADDTELPERFTLGEYLYIRLILDETWRECGRYEPINVVSLSVDSAKTTCLCPSDLAPNPRLESLTLLIPQTAPRKSLKVAGPVGVQSVLVLLTRHPIPDETVSALMQGQTTETLERLAGQVLAAPADTWRLLRKDYEVV